MRAELTSDDFEDPLAKELAPSGICVNALACGVIDTDMNRCLDDTERKSLEDEIPIGRYGNVQEVALAVWQLINGPKYLTGQIINIDGGLI